MFFYNLFVGTAYELVSFFLQIDTLLDPGLPKVSDSTRGSFHLHGCQVVAQGGNCWYCVSLQVHELAPL